MAFAPTIYFAVANEGTVPRLLALQTAGAGVDARVAGVTALSNPNGVFSAVDGGGNDISGPAYDTVFRVVRTTGSKGTLTLDRASFDLLPLGDQNQLIKAFATSGTIVLLVDVTTAAGTTSHKLPLHLGALRTVDFIVDAAGTAATPAHHAGATGPNLQVPAGTTTTLQCAALGAGALTASAAGVLTVTAAAPPTDLMGQSLQIVVDLTVPDESGVNFHLVTSTGAPNPSNMVPAVLPISLHVPTECLITVDRSGSMGATTPTTDTKWNEAIKASELFCTLFAEAIPVRSTGSATVLDQCKIKFGRWSWTGSFHVEYQPTSGYSAASPALAPQTGLLPDGGTPIGQSLTDGRASFSTTGAWRRRHLLLLTDGMDNAGTPTLVHVEGNPATDLPRLSDSATTGVIVHTISYALPGDTPVIDLHTLASDHGGVFLGSESDSDTYDANLLRDRFLNVLGRVLPIQLAVDVAGTTTFSVEDGVDRAIFIAPGAGPLTASGPGGDIWDSHGTSGSFAWAAADLPKPGTWTVSGASASDKIYAIYDVSLRLSHELEAHGVGRPIKVRARLDFQGQPVRGADVWVGLRRPGESIGEVITQYVRARGVVRALQTRAGQLLYPDLGPILAAALGGQGRDIKRLSAASVAQGVALPSGDTKSLQRLMLEAAERARNLDLQSLGNALQLLEVAPGLYEVEVPAAMTQDEGVYDFAFLAEGLTPAGKPFKRNQRESLALAPVPNLEKSDVLISQLASGSNVTWTATVFPRTATGKALGPGLGYALGFVYASPEDRKKFPALFTIDNLDGTYSTHVELPKGEKLAPLLLALGPNLKHAMPVDDKRRPRRVKVRLEKIQVLDDKDGCLTGAGELVFDTVVAPNANPARAVRTRLPASGVLKVNSGQTVTVNEVIYEGLVEAGANLSVTIGGRELDYLLFFRREEKLARYHRTLPLKSAHLAPGDEPNDPEALSDWKVWYTVEVE